MTSIAFLLLIGLWDANNIWGPAVAIAVVAKEKHRNHEEYGVFLIERRMEKYGNKIRGEVIGSLWPNRRAD